MGCNQPAQLTLEVINEKLIVIALSIINTDSLHHPTAEAFPMISRFFDLGPKWTLLPCFSNAAIICDCISESQIETSSRLAGPMRLTGELGSNNIENTIFFLFAKETKIDSQPFNTTDA